MTVRAFDGAKSEVLRDIDMDLKIYKCHNGKENSGLTDTKIRTWLRTRWSYLVVFLMASVIWKK